MAKDETRRVPQPVMEEDFAAFDALKALPDYAPTNPAYTVAAITQVLESFRAAETIENQAQAELATARDIAVQRAWEFHNLMLAVKDQARAQYGKDSLEVQALGLKRVTEYKPRKPKGGTPGQSS